MKSSPVTSKAALVVSTAGVGLGAALVAGAARASEMTCTPIPNSPSFVCTPATGNLPAPAAHTSWLSTLGPVAHSAAVGAAVVGGLGAVAGFAMGGLPDNPPNPLATGLGLGAVGAIVGGVGGAAVGALGLLF
ncbi:MAG: hypothetical protein U0931_21000 [Vulcanimicrobiota bacterium]